MSDPGGYAMQIMNAAQPQAPVRAAPVNPYAQGLSQQYPWASGIGLNIIDSTGKGDPSRKLEFYQPDERDNPRPGKPTIEVFDKSMKPADLMGEVLSHHLPKVDPNVAHFRSQIIQSMTPQQIQSISGDYQNELRAGLVDPGDNLQAWLQKQGGDSFFRGYPTGQWPADIYTPQQKATYDQMQVYLKSRYGK